jgi:ELP3 family radical SAM enzyme/protein acetyltransferase
MSFLSTNQCSIDESALESWGVPSHAETAAIVKPKNHALSHYVKDLAKHPEGFFSSMDVLRKAMTPLMRKYKMNPSKGDLLTAYRTLLESDSLSAIPRNHSLLRILTVKAIRSESGILNISVSLPPNKFSCKYNCYFCPNEPGMPRSYLSNEDVFARAAKVNFVTVQQVWDRLDALQKNGHPIDKLEFRVLGGTFSCYEHGIADEFVRDLYYAANTYFASAEERCRVPGSIEEEQAINTHTKPHVVGLGVETRPDEITPAEIIRFRRYGVTRVELGVQHTDDALLRKVNRGHGVKQSRAAIKLLKDYGFKVEIHIMADLPGATPEGDKECYRQVLQADPDLIPDYMKDYPCLDVSYTKVKEWKEQGLWKPYAEKTPDAKDLQDVLIYRQQITPKWVRVNRIQRDFRPDKTPCGATQLGFNSVSIRSNLAQIVKDAAEAQGIYCQCIRCCEVRDQSYSPSEVTYKVVSFQASGATEYFLSAEVDRPNRPLLLGFLRLRISSALQTSILPELQGSTAMIRELHVYGRVQEVGDRSGTSQAAQHLGIGKCLVGMAETFAKQHRCTQIAVISGIGVRDYYAKRGYSLVGTYMIKQLPSYSIYGGILSALLAVLAIFLAFFLHM